MEKGKITKITLEQRKTTFREVSQGFSEQDALKEAQRCLQCPKAPCIAGCPAGIDIRTFIGKMREKDYSGAIKTIKENNSLPGVCGRVCPQEEQCQQACVLNKTGNPIQIGYLERFSADRELEKSGPVVSDRSVSADKKFKAKAAVIGSGPAGLTCAADLCKSGFEVHLFEALHKEGGVLVYGIPEFRLPKNIVAKEVEYIKSLGVQVHTDSVVGRTQTIDELRKKGFKAFFIGVGAGLPMFLNIPGENLNGVYSANEFLTRVNLMKGYRFPEYDTPVAIGDKVAIIGAGNVSFDCTRCALRLGAKDVYLVYRRSEQEMPARNEEIDNAREEGIQFNLLTSPLEIISDGKGNVSGLKCVKNELGEPDASGRRRPVAVKGSEFVLDVDTVIVAVGTRANPLLTSTMKGLEVSPRGYIKVNDCFQSSVSDIFAGGDIVSGSATVISAICQARKAAKCMIDFLNGEKSDN